MVRTYSRRLVSDLAEIIFEGLAKKATKYISPTLVVKATYQGKRRERDTRRTILITAGRPNYKERAFIKKCRQAGEPFPVKKIQIQR